MAMTQINHVFKLGDKKMFTGSIIIVGRRRRRV